MLRRRTVAGDELEPPPDPHAPAVTEPDALTEQAPNLEPQGDFGHPAMTLLELIANLRQRSEHARTIDDVAVSRAELDTLLNALEATL